MAISGVDRYQTAALVADVFLVLLGSEGPVVAGLATGANFPGTSSRTSISALAQALTSGSSDPPEQPKARCPQASANSAAIREVEAWGENVPLDVGAPSPRPVLRIAPGARAARPRPR